MIKHVFLIGPSYSGKNEFSKKLSILGYRHYSLGDICRSLKYPVRTSLKIDDLEQLVLQHVDFSLPCIIDNIFKTADTVEIIDRLKKAGKITDSSFVVLEIDDSTRKNIDFSKRRRQDDSQIAIKRQQWTSQIAGIHRELQQRHIDVHKIDSIDGGFLLKF